MGKFVVVASGMSVGNQRPSAFQHAMNRLVPGGACPTCGSRIEGIEATGPVEQCVEPCGCGLGT
jgi:hypothetical protein